MAGLATEPRARRLHEVHPAVVAAVVLGIAMLGALVLYGPALRSGFYADDYTLLGAARELSWREYTEASFASRSAPVGPYWRPLYMMTIYLLHAVFGAEPTPFHLVLFASHLVSIGLIWAVARRLTGGFAGPAVGAIVFAVHPAAFGAVTWIATMTSLALPFALGAWLTLLHEHPRSDISATRVAAVTVLFAMAVGFRETAAVVIVAAAAVRLATARQERGFSLRPVLPLVPSLVLAAVVFVVSGRPFSGSTSLPGTTVSDVADNYWAQLQHGLTPLHNSGTFPPDGLRSLGAVALAATPVLLLMWRRWLPFALTMAFLASLLPYSLTLFGAGPRYFYLPCALLALALAAIVQEIVPLLSRVRPRRRPAAAALSLLLALAGVMTWYGRPTVRAWVDDGPSMFDQFVSELRAEHPDLPSADTLYVANLPLHLALFDGYFLPPILDSMWPDTDTDVEFVAIEDIEQRRATLGQNERLFVFGPQTGACAAAAAQPAPSTEIPPPSRLQVRAVEGATAAAPVPLISFGPSVKGDISTLSWELDGAGHTRTRFDVPWFPPQVQAWQPAETGSSTEVAIVAVPSADVYQLSVDGQPFATYPLTEVDASGQPRLIPTTIGSSASVQPGVGIEHELLQPSPCRPRG